MSVTAHDNSRWVEIGSAIEAFVGDYPNRALFINKYAYARDDWVGLVAVTADTDEETEFFGTRTLNLVILSRPLAPDDNYPTQRDRILATFAKFSGYKTIVYIDIPTIVGLNPDEDIPALTGAVEGVCSELEDCGFVYGGSVDHAAADAEDFRSEIEDFFGLS